MVRLYVHHLKKKVEFPVVIIFDQLGSPTKCSDDRRCKSKQGKCVAGFCRCVGMYAGDGMYCRSKNCVIRVQCRARFVLSVE